MGLGQYANAGLLAPAKIAHAFRTTSEEVAGSARPGRDAVQRPVSAPDVAARFIRDINSIDKHALTAAIQRPVSCAPTGL
jgi:hypothetical protein